MSREEVTSGNLVSAGQTLLTTVVSVDKIYAEFETDEQVYLKYAAATRAGERGNARDSKLPVWIGLADEKGTPHEGQMVFLDNALDAQTGTIRARALLDNKDRRFTPRPVRPREARRQRQVRGGAGQRQRDRHGPERALRVRRRPGQQGRVPRGEARPRHRRWPARRA